MHASSQTLILSTVIISSIYHKNTSGIISSISSSFHIIVDGNHLILHEQFNPYILKFIRHFQLLFRAPVYS